MKGVEAKMCTFFSHGTSAMKHLLCKPLLVKAIWELMKTETSEISYGEQLLLLIMMTLK